MGEFYLVKELTRSLRVSERHVRRLIAADQLKAVKIGRKWLIPHDAVTSFLEAHGHNPNRKATL